ncbi:hypothetical protein [Enterococcus sp. HY326]|uniref:hypothetical protein n=1 Tax=Enterococcus sp. HY326 TaxID=2971265 RepID=UPI0022408E5B|nr:hypothetical protein [Enterococcus sp. HY326]
MTNKTVVNENDLKVLKKYVEKHIHLPNTLSEEYIYSNPNLIIIDAVLSKNRNYNSVQKWIKNFEKCYPKINTLIGLIEIIDQETPKEIGRIIGYRDEKRIIEIRQVAVAFVEKKSSASEDDLKSMKKWAEMSDFTDTEDSIFKVNGIGVATFQYLRILLGVNTCKPDVHIKNFILEVLKKEFSEEKAIRAIEKVSNKLGKDTRIVDNAIWKFMRSKDGFDKVDVEDLMYYIDFLDKGKLIQIQKYLEEVISEDRS